MSQRQTGRTTKQMNDAPVGSVFVVTSGSQSYTNLLAKHINRSDLIIVTDSWLTEQNIAGTKTKIILDHFTREIFGGRRRYLLEAIQYNNAKLRHITSTNAP